MKINSSHPFDPERILFIVLYCIVSYRILVSSRTTWYSLPEVRGRQFSAVAAFYDHSLPCCCTDWCRLVWQISRWPTAGRHALLPLRRAVGPLNDLRWPGRGGGTSPRVIGGDGRPGHGSLGRPDPVCRTARSVGPPAPLRPGLSAPVPPRSPPL